MVFEAIDQQRQELTDKYVIVIGDRPELARFEGVVGQVKTVNMSGRALVEFTGLHNNVGWFDIDPHFLRVVDKPADEPAKPAKKPASKIPGKAGVKSAADILALARGAGPAKPKADAAGRSAKVPGPQRAQPQRGKPKRVSPSAGKSTADILAAARGGGGAAKPPPASKGSSDKGDKKTSPAVNLSAADVLAAARGKPSPANDPPRKKPAVTKATSMSTADILAAARAQKAPEKKSDSAADAAASVSVAPRPEPRRLSAADILAIAQGKKSQRREPVVHTTPLSKKRLEAAGDVRPETLPEPLDTTKLTAEAIRDLGGKK